MVSIDTIILILSSIGLVLPIVLLFVIAIISIFCDKSPKGDKEKREERIYKPIISMWLAIVIIIIIVAIFGFADLIQSVLK